MSERSERVINTSDARILDQGYRRYEGPRRGQVGAVRSLAVHGVIRALGLRRTFWAKLLPLASVVIAYLPAIVFVGIAALIPGELDELFEYHEYYSFITLAIILFVAMVGPEVLCSDRRNGMLGMYLASPLTRETYLLAKALAVVPVLGLVTIGPPLLLVIGLSLADAGPDGVGGLLLVVGRILLAGVAVSAAYAAVSLAAASLTERRAVASGGIILLLFTSSAVGSSLADVRSDDIFQLLNLTLVPFELTQRIFGEPGGIPEVGTVVVVVANVLWTVSAGFVLWWRYRRLTVAR